MPNMTHLNFSQPVSDLLRSLNVSPLNYEESLKTPLPMDSRQGGMYDSVQDAIFVNDAYPIPDIPYDFIVLHELIHWSGHSSRLGRTAVVNSQNTKTHKLITRIDIHTEEMTANYGMLYLIEVLGLDTIHARGLIDLYVSEMYLADIVKAGVDADQAVNYLLTMAKQSSAKVA